MKGDKEPKRNDGVGDRNPQLQLGGTEFIFIYLLFLKKGKNSKIVKRKERAKKLLTCVELQARKSYGAPPIAGVNREQEVTE